jgi:hypothetical protein
VDLWWLDQHGITSVVPVKDNMAVTLVQVRLHLVYSTLILACSSDILRYHGIEQPLSYRFLAWLRAGSGGRFQSGHSIIRPPWAWPCRHLSDFRHGGIEASRPTQMPLTDRPS